MDLKQFFYFIAVAERQNFSRAAESLYISQPALSQRIAELENEFGVKLLIRTNKGVKLTEPGIVFLQAAKEISEKINDLPFLIRQASGDYEIEHAIRLHLTKDAIGASWLQPILVTALREVKILFHNLTIQINELAPEDIDSLLLSDRTDMVIYSSHTEPAFGSEIRVQRLYHDQISLVVSKNHPLNRPGITAKELLSSRDAELLLLDMNTNAQIQMSQILADMNVKPNLRYPENKELAILQTCAGLGMFFYPKRMLSTNTSALEMLDLLDLPVNHSSLSFYACRKTNRNNFAVEFIINLLLRLCNSEELSRNTLV